MGMTMTQKILAAHAGLDSVVAGQLIRAKLDMVLGNDITTPVAVNEFEKAGFELEEFGENTIKLNGVPTVCYDLDTKELFLETLDEINTVARTAKQEIEERFIEPPSEKRLPFSLLFQQTLSTVASSGAITAKKLAEKILALPPFEYIDESDYKTLLLSMINNDWLEMTDEREIIVGLRGERLVNSFKFYAVFKDSEDFTKYDADNENCVLLFSLLQVTHSKGIYC